MNDPTATQGNANSSSGRRLLSTSYKSFDPIDIGDRYVHFLLENEPTLEKLTSCVLSDHLRNGLQVVKNEEEESSTRAQDSIEVDAFQLIVLDPILGNLTLRYPDTLLPLLEDSTVQARRVLRRRMEVALQQGLETCTKALVTKAQTHDETNKQLLSVLQANDQYDPRPLRARLVHLPPHHQCCKPTLSSINASDVGTVVQIHGTCVRTGPVRMMETIRTYKCLDKNCGCEFEVMADFGTTNNALPAPVICPAEYEECSCKSTSFAMVERASHHCDYQEIKVQESAGALTRVGSVPRSILIKLTDDLVDKCNPGDEVVVVGSLHAEWQSGTSGFGNNLEIMVGMSMQAHSVRVVNVDEEVVAGSSLALNSVFGTTSGNLRERYRREFEAFWSNEVAKKHPIATRDYILRAVCPKLYGMHAVKLGLLLALIGGASVPNQNEYVDLSQSQEEERKAKQDSMKHDAVEAAGPVAFRIGGDNNMGSDEDTEVKPKRKKVEVDMQSNNSQSVKAVRSRRRTQSHILLLGDPGTGKSQFLRFAAALSPRSVLTTGTGSSTAGLTCAAIKDSGNEFSLEAGALALADRGVCCIDEFGCMSKEDRTSIHEAMEQQTISVAKAGIVCKLNARATVVAVMNPTGGIYNHELSLESNARLGSALLSRFDLIFIMLDQADINRDLNIAQFLLQQSISPGSGYDRPLEIENSLNDADDTNGHWSMEKLRAYLAIVRDKFHPTLTSEAAQLLENHYNLCRQKEEKSLPITVRFLESLIRLSQAHARLMFRNEVLLDDAVAVILLMNSTAIEANNHTFRSPTDTPFSPFLEADAMFEEEKQKLYFEHKNYYDQKGRRPPSTPRFQRSYASQQDQWGREMLTQIELTQNPPSHRFNEAQNAMAMINDYTPSNDSTSPYNNI